MKTYTLIALLLISCGKQTVKKVPSSFDTTNYESTIAALELTVEQLTLQIANNQEQISALGAELKYTEEELIALEQANAILQETINSLQEKLDKCKAKKKCE